MHQSIIGAPCGVCREVVTAGHQGRRCELCGKVFHYGCADKTVRGDGRCDNCGSALGSPIAAHKQQLLGASSSLQSAICAACNKRFKHNEITCRAFLGLGRHMCSDCLRDQSLVTTCWACGKKFRGSGRKREVLVDVVHSALPWYPVKDERETKKLCPQCASKYDASPYFFEFPTRTRAALSHVIVTVMVFLFSCLVVLAVRGCQLLFGR
jgi:hypothetical protein